MSRDETKRDETRCDATRCDEAGRDETTGEERRGEERREEQREEEKRDQIFSAYPYCTSLSHVFSCVSLLHASVAGRHCIFIACLYYLSLLHVFFHNIMFVAYLQCVAALHIPFAHFYCIYSCATVTA